MRFRIHPFRGRRALDGFTLLEVVLAIAITIGLMTVVLFFYRQTAHLRTELTREAETISAARLLMDRLTVELRAARPFDSFSGLNGGNDFIEFVTTQIPMQRSWSANELETPPGPESDLKVVRYSVQTGAEGAGGIERLEKPFGMFGLFTSLPLDDEDDLFTEADGNQDALLLTRDLRLLRFRYWNGTEWLNNWNSPRLPAGIEITLGTEPFSGDGEDGGHPYEQFKRLVFLPGHAIESFDDDLFFLLEEEFE